MERKQRLELNWIGKDERPRLEPRVLLMDPEKSYCGDRPAPEHSFDNRLIFGDNLLALKALEAEFSEKVRAVYIDPPFNTKQAFEYYDDGVEHSIWLGLIRDRIDIIWNLLGSDGTLFVHIDDNELGYLIAILDEKFGRKNRIAVVTFKQGAATGHKAINPGVVSTSNFILIYAKDKERWKPNKIFTVRNERDTRYGQFIRNFDDHYSKWEFVTLASAFAKSIGASERGLKKALGKDYEKKISEFVMENATQVVRLARPDYNAISADARTMVDKSKEKLNEVHFLARSAHSDMYFVRGERILFYSDKLKLIDGRYVAGEPLTSIWDDLLSNNLHNEGGVEFPKGKKPEGLIKRCIELSTDAGDIVLDSFAGSGTTGVVAHKMGRRWIMVELGEHCHTHIIPRLKKVIDGDDPSGITETMSWKGGGGFRYFRLAPSLLEKDHWGNWVISRDYNAAMLAEAMCKHMGYTYAPSQEPAEYWRHGQSSERDFIYVTTASLSHDQLKAISLDLGPERTLLICCKAFSAKADQFENLTIRKIPLTVLSRCEWGRDDYSLKIISQATVDDDEEDIEDRTAAVESKKRGRKPKANDQPMLALGEEEK